MKNSVVVKLWMSIAGVFIGLIVGEAGIRLFSSYDADGNARFLRVELKPFHLPITTTEKKIREYSSSTTRIAYDPVLGWAPRPNSESSDGLYRYNSAGIRSAPSEYSLTPKEGRLRIAIFGDSFTHGDEVTFGDTWGDRLERDLSELGIDVEVMNFGVGGYGIDQAFLRWERFGFKYHPHIVIHGFQAENIARNLNLFRPIHAPNASIPFSKPRFVLDGAQLKLINVPTVPPERIVDVMKNIESWDLGKYEYFYDPKDYLDSVWFRSKIVSLVVSAGSSASFHPDANPRRLYDMTREPAQLTLRIIREFKEGVAAKGGKFLMVHLPTESDLTALQRGRGLPYSALLEAMDENNVIRPEREMLKQESFRRSLFSRIHYNGNGNKIVAGTIATFIKERVLTHPDGNFHR